MSALKAILYRGPDADLTLPIQILRVEGIHWQIVDDVRQMMVLAKGRANPQSGWCVYMPLLDKGASTWTGIYSMLAERGLLRC